jgi:heptosyltransferase II
MVMAQSLFMALKQLNPMCQIDVLAPSWTFALLEKMPEVQQAIPLPTQRGQLGLWQRYQLGRNLRANRYSQAIVLPNSWKSALVPLFANIPKRTGYRGEWRWGLLNDVHPLDKQQLKMTVQRFVALASLMPATAPPICPNPILAVDSAGQQAVRQKFQLNATTPAIALCPGAEYGSAKRWPSQHFAAIAKHQLALGWQVWLLGSSKDSAIANEINAATNNACHNFTGATSLAEAVALLSLAEVVVSNDSGLMHVAAALDKPVVALYGSSDPHFTPPLSPKAKILSLSLSCAPCFKRECPLYPPGHTQHTECLSRILPEQVLAAIGTLH